MTKGRNPPPNRSSALPNPISSSKHETNEIDDEVVGVHQEDTIASNLRAMLSGAVALRADEYTGGGKTTGSLLLARMTVAGS